MNHEREQIAEVFGLTGGELSDEPWVPIRADGTAFTFTYWYSGAPEYAERDLEREHGTNQLRTVCRDEMFGQVPETVTDDEGTWHVVARFSSSGEVECPGKANDGELSDRFPLPCPACEGDDAHGHIYIGDGWSEVVYRLEDEDSNEVEDNTQDALSIVYGTASEADGAADPFLSHPNVRSYVVGERGFFGHDTSDIAHVCDRDCLAVLLRRAEDFEACESDDAYVNVNEESLPTIDVVDFDRGDDPYVLCDACNAVLYRDDAAYETQYGRPLNK